MGNLENRDQVNEVIEDNGKEQKVEVETNGQIRIVFDEEKNECEEKVEEEKKEEVDKKVKVEDDDPNQDELYRFDPEIEHYWDR